MHKKCLKCELVKSVSEFYQRKKHRSGEYYETCKECMKTRGRSYYHNNHERQLELAKKRKKKYIEERLQFLADLKKKGCTDCKKIYPPWVMDFDHKDGYIKLATISFMALRNTSNLEKIKLELGKCDLVCANCHRIRTHDRIQKRKAAIANVVKALV